MLSIAGDGQHSF